MRFAGTSKRVWAHCRSYPLLSGRDFARVTLAEEKMFNELAKYMFGLSCEIQ
jgi:hypothetical protein